MGSPNLRPSLGGGRRNTGNEGDFQETQTSRSCVIPKPTGDPGYHINLWRSNGTGLRARPHSPHGYYRCAWRKARGHRAADCGPGARLSPTRDSREGRAESRRNSKPVWPPRRHAHWCSASGTRDPPPATRGGCRWAPSEGHRRSRKGMWGALGSS